jgi:ABC-type glycerol-3-phosphate transport system substrate-binding protein
MPPEQRRARVIAGLAASLLVIACAGDGADTGATADTADPTEPTAATGEPPEAQRLVDHALWSTAQAADDPLAEHRPEPLECGIAGWYEELGELEVDTNFCDYADLTQPALVEIAAGSQLALTFRHYDLTAAAPAQAHIALLIGGDLIWEELIDIPGPAAVRMGSATIQKNYPQGAPVRLHLHNHGQNTWILGLTTVTAPE